ncbi:MAG: ZPR1 zinc finger domain-containing protein [Euryarchaeota archaeon]|jgi:zinc finger protein|nr:ZPR1 zinc finger domain-containing protein [Euryarchaeota archaeon]MBT5254537.1 ZPR1 zinc finger domain-containing protein [Euryarchaeota archaeon]MDG1547068.1 ZPR1 zinc finger domain-containing protein [Candidatus Poseidoniaceae archaeon]
MEPQDVNIPCPICSIEGEVKMIAHVDEIPYFGEHTQVTVLCNSCGWRQTDFIPAEGKKSGAWKIVIDNPEKLLARVVRSSSCTVKVDELDLVVNPGSNSTGYVSNIEGVMNRFIDVINMVLRDVQNEALQHAAGEIEEGLEETMEAISKLENMLSTIGGLKEVGSQPVTLELLDPNGHSMIIHEDAVERELSEEELVDLPVGPDPPVLSNDD